VAGPGWLRCWLTYGIVTRQLPSEPQRTDRWGSDDRADLRAHVAGCANCAGQAALLVDARSLLGDLPAPPVPPDVVGRLDTALAAEARRPAGHAVAAASVAGPAGSVTLLPASAGRGSRRAWANPGAVAAGIVVLLGAVVGIGTLIGRDGSQSSTKSSASRSVAGLVKSPGLVTGTGRDYTAAALDPYVRTLLATPGAATGTVPQSSASPATAPTPSPQLPTAVDPTLARLQRPGQLQACVDELAGRRGVVPIAVDFARFQGRPAVIVVLADPEPARVQAWVVGAGCRSGQAELLRYQVVRLAG